MLAALIAGSGCSLLLDDPGGGPDLDCGECSEDAPICSARGCVACESHDDCESGACDVTGGVCFDGATELVFVSPDGNRGASCTADDPCRQLIDVETLGPAAVILAPGSYELPVEFRNQDLRIIGFGARLSGAAEIRANAAARITVEGVSLSTASASGFNLRCEGQSSAMTLIEVEVADSSGAALSANCGSVVIRRSSFVNNGGGLQINGSNFSIRDSLFAANKGVAVGAIDLGGASTGTIELTTVLDNASPGGGEVGGIDCSDLNEESVMVRGSVVWSSFDDQSVSNNCLYSNSNVEGIEASAGNFSEDPVYDERFRPLPGWPGQDLAPLAGLVATGDRDLDLVLRSQPPDIGAFEVTD